MGDPASSRQRRRLWLLPSCRCVCGCGCRAAILVRGLVMGTDVVNLFRHNSDVRIAIHLRTLSGGERHSAAQYPTFNYLRRGPMASSVSFVSITTSRLAVLVSQILRPMRHLVIRDWKSARVLLVRRSFSYSTKKLDCLSRSWKRSVTSRWHLSMIIGYWQS